MTFSAMDLRYLRGSLTMLVLALLLAAAVLYGSNHILDQAGESMVMAEGELAGSLEKLQRVRLEQEDLHEYYQQYQTLVRNHVIGPERRLDWIEAVERTRHQQGVFSVRYKLDPQKQIRPETPVPESIYTLNLSSMTLEFSLLHEAQLFGFLDALHGAVKGMYRLERCHMSRISPAQELRFSPNVKAECLLNWVTLTEQHIGEKK